MLRDAEEICVMSNNGVLKSITKSKSHFLPLSGDMETVLTVT